MTNYNERLDKILNSDGGVLHCCGDYQEEAKQTITSLIKELVAEAKPEEKEHHNGANPIEVVWETGYNEAAREFEQNLLKALEEV